MNESIYFSTAAEWARLLRARKISSVELTAAYIDRLERLGPRYHAVAEITRDRALAQARAADKRLRREEHPSPLLGIPYGAKDLLATAGIPTRWGAPPYRDQVFDYDATVIRKMEEAGAVLIGKLAMVELAGGGGYQYADASLHGPGLNPWNLGYWSGGSSSGSGSAVAAGLVPLALGSETWGSIVTPAAYCGLSGLRPTWGLVSRYGAMELAWTMDKVGPLAHSAEDCGWALQAIAGYDPEDFTSLETHFHFHPRRKAPAYRIGALPADFTGEPELEKAYSEALRVLRRLGFQVRETTLPDRPYEQTALTLLRAEMAAAHKELAESERLDELVDKHQVKGFREALEVKAVDFVRAEQSRERIAAEVLATFDEYDALVSPAVMGEATPLEANLHTGEDRKGNYTVLGALCGVPSLCLPIGFGAHGLPLSMALTGDLLGEESLLQIGMAFQRETDWHRREPKEL